jgi:8-oxo-dGTP pyrophosphatase MutT (NUDIX family)
MKMRFENEDDFRLFKEELKHRLARHSIRTMESDGYRRSAVKILIMNKENEPHVLLTKRTHKVSTHKGQISFPGGGYDEGDGEILNTALRETYEEVGIPAEAIEYIGQFDDYVSIFGHHVSCFVGAITHPFPYEFNDDEISDYVEAPLRLFVNREYERLQTYQHEGKDYTVYHYLFNGYEIWGLTARILTDFAGKIMSEVHE